MPKDYLLINYVPTSTRFLSSELACVRILPTAHNLLGNNCGKLVKLQDQNIYLS